MTDCSVCCNTLNDTNRKVVSCDFCSYLVCLACTKKYIIETVHQPHCMNCRKEWSLDKLNKYFSKYFLMGEYRKMRENVLFEEEKTYFPELQEEAERLMTMEKIKQQQAKIERKIIDNNMNEEQLVREQRATDRLLRKECYDLSVQYSKLSYRERTRERKKFIMKCVVENCRGFLSDKYECGLCLAAICKECHHVIGTEHTCKPEDVATIKELQQNTKPCPKCHIRIYKIDGCDQMFCIQCHTAFSWNTGMIENGVIHNPEYFRALRQGNITDPRHRQEHGGCGPIPNYHSIYQMLFGQPREYKDRIERYYQQMFHHRNVVLPRLMNQVNRDNDRIRYLMGNIEEKTFKQKLYVHHQSNARRREEHQIIDSYVTIGEEMFRTLTCNNVEDMLNQFKLLSEVTRDAIIGMDRKYQHKGHIQPNEIYV